MEENKTLILMASILVLSYSKPAITSTDLISGVSLYDSSGEFVHFFLLCLVPLFAFCHHCISHTHLIIHLSFSDTHHDMIS